MQLLNGKSRNSRNHVKHRENGNVVISEWRLGLIGLIFSLFVITSKVLYANRDNLERLIFEKEWKTYQTIVTDGEVVVGHAWVTALRYSWFWFPIVCGSLATWFTGLMVYIDSSVPGVQPPSPLSPSKYKLSLHSTSRAYLIAHCILPKTHVLFIEHNDFLGNSVAELLT
ncbi:hypothetical protein FQA39_LY03618 [Lamprigera yunnana]|nr:hypothetical protein FQA39_LY03618 [Lamprigera yunnana]